MQRQKGLNFGAQTTSKMKKKTEEKYIKNREGERGSKNIMDGTN